MAQPVLLRTPAEEALVRRFAEEEGALPGVGPVQARREEAFRAFAAAGLPHRRLEEWRYTDLRTLLRTIPPAAPPAGRDDVLRLLPRATNETRRLIIANGRFLPEESDLADLEPGLALRSLADSLARGEVPPSPSFAADNTAVLLNTAFMSDGLMVTLAAGTVLRRPLEIVHVTGGAEPVSTTVRHAVSIGRNAQGALVETFLATADLAHHGNAMTILTLEEGAHFSHSRHIAGSSAALSLTTLSATLAARARLQSFTAVMGGGIDRAQIFARLAGEGAEGDFRGVTLVKEAQQADLFLAVTHDAPNTKSREIYKAVADGRARSSFQGRITVPAHAQKTDARLNTASLLLSPEAEANAKPELEIFADDVQCGHGATVGALDETLLFYMLARGLPRAEAETLLILAFLAEAIEGMEDETLHARFLATAEAAVVSLRRASQPRTNASMQRK